jgi:hypothetical protein
VLSFKTRLVDSLVFAMLVLVILSGAACNDDDDDLLGSSPPYDLTFSLDASFHGPHGGQAIEWAVVRSADGVIEAQGSGRISRAKDPAFSFTAFDVMERGPGYEVHYWIDSNIGGGTPGVCDPRAVDHQWSVEFRLPTNDVNFTTSYAPALTEDVCATFL